MKPGRWFLMSCRPAEAARVMLACEEAGMRQPLELVIDERRVGIGKLMGDVFRAEPDLAFYGWLADDTFPRTPGFDVTLSRAAGEWMLAYAGDGGLVQEKTLREGRELSSGLCFGGMLVRAAGWWALPGLEAAWIDVAWCEIISRLSLHAYTPEVLVDHYSHLVGRRDRDEHDLRSFATIDRTRAFYEGWRDGGGLASTIAGILGRLPRPLLERAVRRMLGIDTVDGWEEVMR